MNNLIKKNIQPIVRRLSEPVDTDLTSLVRRAPEKQYTQTEIFLLLCASFCFGVLAGIVLMHDRAQHGTILASDWKASLLIPAFMMLAGGGLWMINDARKNQ